MTPPKPTRVGKPAAPKDGLKRKQIRRVNTYESARMFCENYEKVFCKHRPWLSRTGRGSALNFGAGQKKKIAA